MNCCDDATMRNRTGKVIFCCVLLLKNGTNRLDWMLRTALVRFQIFTESPALI
jgi:hypothetical protein